MGKIKGICLVPGCENAGRSRGLCQTHGKHKKTRDKYGAPSSRGGRGKVSKIIKKQVKKQVRKQRAKKRATKRLPAEVVDDGVGVEPVPTVTSVTHGSAESVVARLADIKSQIDDIGKFITSELERIKQQLG